MKPFSLNRGPYLKLVYSLQNNSWLIIIIFFPNPLSFLFRILHFRILGVEDFSCILSKHTHKIGNPTLSSLNYSSVGSSHLSYKAYLLGLPLISVKTVGSVIYDVFFSNSDPCPPPVEAHNLN